MVLTCPVTVKKKTTPVRIQHWDKLRKAVALTAAVAATAIIAACANEEPEPMHTSWQAGQRWIDELLQGMFPICFLCMWLSTLDIVLLCCQCRRASCFPCPLLACLFFLAMDDGDRRHESVRRRKENPKSLPRNGVTVNPI
ncbi:hypothetical protein C8R45DRAFT_998934 [Mycena sanguinolenta]|nr:hypothetical protein C8R45DRAFT_998934 [Mycena sanguinolenta]